MIIIVAIILWGNSSLTGLKAFQYKGVHTWYCIILELLLAAEVREPRGELTPAPFISQYNSQLHYKHLYSQTSAVAYSTLKKILFVAE